MVDLKYNILNLIYSTPSRKESLENIINSNFDTPIATKRAIDELVSINLIKKLVNSHSYELTNHGINTFELSQEQKNIKEELAKAKAEAKERDRKNYIISLISLIVAIFGVIIALANFIFICFG